MSARCTSDLMAIGGGACAATQARLQIILVSFTHFYMAKAPSAALERVKALQADLAGSTDLNPIAELISTARSLISANSASETKAVHLATRVVAKSLSALCEQDKIDFTRTDEHGWLVSKEGNDPSSVVAAWLAMQWNDFVALLHEPMLHSEVPTLRLAAVEMSMMLQASSSESLGHTGVPRWSPTPFRSLVDTLLHTTISDDVVDKVAEDYLEIYDDVRFMFCKALSTALKNASPKDTHLRSHALRFLVRITAIPTEDEHLNNFLVPHLAAPARNTEHQGTNDAPMFSDSEEEEDTGAPERATAAAARTASGRKRSRHGNLRDSLHSLGAQRQAFATAWLSLLLPRHVGGAPLGGPLSHGEVHGILVRLHAQILPHLPLPNMVHDFLVDCLDSRGTTALLALNGLYTLIVSHNLDYPAFYTRLYALLDANVLHTKYRSRFMRMLNTFLSSTHLSAALVASFLKRLSRLSLRAPPAAIVEVVPFVWNLLRRHPNCMPMIHREWGGDHLALGPAGVEDGFDPIEPNPTKTGALESSLWEISAFGAHAYALQNQGRPANNGGDAHYLASVSTFARILAEPFTQQRYELEEFLDTTYTTLFETETNKTLKRRQRGDKEPPSPAIRDIETDLGVPALVATVSNNVDAAIRREERKRLRVTAYPAPGDSVENVPLDECARLWDMT